MLTFGKGGDRSPITEGEGKTWPIPGQHEGKRGAGSVRNNKTSLYFLRNETRRVEDRGGGLRLNGAAKERKPDTEKAEVSSAEGDRIVCNKGCKKEVTSEDDDARGKRQTAGRTVKNVRVNVRTV